MRPRQILFDKERLYEEALHLKMQNNDLREENARLKARLNQMEEDRFRKSEELEAERVPSSHLVTGLKQTIKDLRHYVKRRDEDVAMLKRNMKNTRAMEMEVELRTYVEECSRLHKLLGDAENFQDIKDRTDELEEKLKSQTNLALNLKQEVKQLTRVLSDTREECEREKETIAQLEKKMKHKKTTEQINMLSLEVQKLKNQVEAGENEKTRLEGLIQERNGELERLISELKQAQDTISNKTANETTLLRDIKTAQEKIKTLEAQHRSVREAMDSATRTIRDLEQAKSLLEGQTEELNRALAKKTSALQAMKQDLETQISALTRSNADVLTATEAAFKQEKDALVLDLEAKTSALEDAQYEVQVNADAVQEHLQSIAQLQGEIRELQTQINEKRTEIEVLKAAILSSDSKIEAEKRLVADLESQMHQKDLDLERLRDQLSEALRKVYKKMNKQVGKRHKSVSELVQDLDVSGSGYISPADLKAGLKAAGIKIEKTCLKVVTVLLEDGEGKVSLKKLSEELDRGRRKDSSSSESDRSEEKKSKFPSPPREEKPVSSVREIRIKSEIAEVEIGEKVEILETETARGEFGAPQEEVFGEVSPVPLLPQAMEAPNEQSLAPVLPEFDAETEVKPIQPSDESLTAPIAVEEHLEKVEEMKFPYVPITEEHPEFEPSKPSFETLMPPAPIQEHSETEGIQSSEEPIFASALPQTIEQFPPSLEEPLQVEPWESDTAARRLEESSESSRYKAVEVAQEERSKEESEVIGAIRRSSEPDVFSPNLTDQKELAPLELVPAPMKVEVLEDDPEPSNQSYQDRITVLFRHMSMRLQINRIPKEDLSKLLYSPSQPQHIPISAVKTRLSQPPLNLTDPEDQQLMVLTILEKRLNPGNVARLWDDISVTVEKTLEVLNAGLGDWKIFTPEDEQEFDNLISSAMANKATEFTRLCETYQKNASGNIEFVEFQEVLQKLQIQFSENCIRYLRVLFYSQDNLLDQVPYASLVSAYVTLPVIEDLSDVQRTDIVREQLKLIAKELIERGKTAKEVFPTDAQGLISPGDFRTGLVNLQFGEIQADVFNVVVESLQYEKADRPCIYIEELEELLDNYGVRKTVAEKTEEPNEYEIDRLEYSQESPDHKRKSLTLSEASPFRTSEQPPQSSLPQASAVPELKSASSSDESELEYAGEDFELDDRM